MGRLSFLNVTERGRRFAVKREFTADMRRRDQSQVHWFDSRKPPPFELFHFVD